MLMCSFKHIVSLLKGVEEMWLRHSASHDLTQDKENPCK